jgi:predicted transcriptional regulator
MKYRSRTDIIAMILQSSMNGGASKTHLMYGAYLSYAQIQEYLEFLIAKALITREEGTQLYKLTEKGLHFLRTYSEISSLLAIDRAKPQPDLTASTSE